MKYFSWIIGTVIFAVLLSTCSEGERVEPEGDKKSGSGSTGIFNDKANSDAVMPNADGQHQVEVLEVLNTSKYAYLRVSENGREPYWIATMRADFNEGQKLVYEGGLLKTDFKSIEHNRVFDQVYLVSKIGFLDGEEVSMNEKVDEATKTVSTSFKKPDQPDIVDLSEIVSNPEQYENKTVKVYGEVVKVNPNIMGRNWLHIKDGTADDFDFVLTAESAVPVGHAMVFEGTISLNRDFGAGYTYDLILENAQLVR